jgi:hypothetical protein
MLAAYAALTAQISELPSLEYQVKAAFLLNFTKFVEWRATETTAHNAPINICLQGAPFGSFIDQIVADEVVNERRLSVHRLQRGSSITCHVLFVGGSETDIPELLAKMSRGTLTVGEGEQFLRQGGMIAFVIDNRRVRFDVNLRAAQNAGIHISSRLLKVARSVEK